MLGQVEAREYGPDTDFKDWKVVVNIEINYIHFFWRNCGMRDCPSIWILLTCPQSILFIVQRADPTGRRNTGLRDRF
jgi:hypothetical protein